MSVNNWYSIIAEWIKNLFNLNKKKDMEALRLLEKVLSDAKLKFEEPLKVQAINIFFWAKHDGEANKYAVEQALLCASGENLKLYEKARRIYKALSLKLDRPKKTMKRSTRLVHKHVSKKNDKPKLEKKSKNIASETPNRENDKWRLGTRILIIALLVLLVIVVIIVSCKTQPAAVIVNETTTTVATAATAVATSTTIAPAVTTWKMESGNYGNNRWFADGIIEIKEAKTPEQAMNAARVWLDRVKRDPNLLIAVIKSFLNKDADKATLVDKDGWATDKAVQFVAELELAINKSNVKVEKAPQNGWNTGVNNDTVVRAKKAVISGDRSGIRIDIILLDGKVVSFWIMARCGNIVTKEKPSLPIGKTDNPVTIVTTTTATATTALPVTTVPVTTTTVPEETTTTVPEETTTTTTPPTTTLAPKSPDEADYKQPGDGSETDSGTGDKPIVTEVTTPPESIPTDVVTEEVVNGVTETVTNPIGSETGVDAAGTTDNSVTSTTTPPPETGVNPGASNDGTNTGDSGIPSNF